MINGTFPIAAIPEATEAIFCSAIPISIKRFGKAFAKMSVLVDSVRSQQSATTCSSRFPASRRPSPKPLRLGTRSIVSEVIFGCRCFANIKIRDELMSDPVTESYRRACGVFGARLLIVCRAVPYLLAPYQEDCRASGSHAQTHRHLLRQLCGR